MLLTAAERRLLRSIVLLKAPCALATMRADATAKGCGPKGVTLHDVNTSAESILLGCSPSACAERAAAASPVDLLLAEHGALLRRSRQLSERAVLGAGERESDESIRRELTRLVPADRTIREARNGIARNGRARGGGMRGGRARGGRARGGRARGGRRRGRGSHRTSRSARDTRDVKRFVGGSEIVGGDAVDPRHGGPKLPLPPILLVHGRMDCVVPTPQSLRLLHVLRNVSASAAEIRLLPRAGHFFEPEPPLIRTMLRFIEQQGDSTTQILPVAP